MRAAEARRGNLQGEGHIGCLRLCVLHSVELPNYLEMFKNN